MRIKLLSTILVAACSAPAVPPTAPASAPAPARAAPARAAPAPQPGPVSTPAPEPSSDSSTDNPAKFEVNDVVNADKCVASVRGFDRITDADVIRHDMGGGESGGISIDELAEEAMKKVPIAGVCDARTRSTLEATIASASGGKSVTSAPWDHKATIAYRDSVTAALGLTPDEQHQLERDGFAAVARLDYGNFASAFYDIHRAQLPVYVSADSVLHAIFASHDQLLARLETELLEGRLDRALGLMHCHLASVAKDYPREVAQDLDLYLTVARSLLASNYAGSNAMVRAELGQDAEAKRIVELIAEAGPARDIELFGRKRAFDVSMYTPRGHYEDGSLRSYFRAAMWMSRLELNLVSRDTRSSAPGLVEDPRETPREAVDALALADLAERSGALVDLSAIDRAWAAFAGTREDVSLALLAKLRREAGIGKLEVPGSATKLRTAIGSRFQRTINIFPNPNVRNLPVITTAIGPRITADTVALGELPVTEHPGEAAAQVGFMLGQNRARAYLPKAVEQAKLDAARVAIRSVSQHDDMYGAWLKAILALAETPRGVRPSFMTTPVFADMRLDTALVAYGQLRHNHVLVVAQQYDVGGCEIPDGYVEPVPAVYTALQAWAKRGSATFAALDPKDVTHGAAYFKRTERVLGVLAAIANHELAGRALTDEEKRFLAMVVEMRPAEAWNYNGSFPVPTYDGWYMDLFPSSDVAFHDATFIADYATHIHETAQWVDYLGAKRPRIGVFVVDTGGGPRLMAGPVAQAFAATGPVEHRFADSTAAHANAVMPWSGTYTVAAPAEPVLDVHVVGPHPKLPRGPRPNEKDPAPGIDLDASKPLGDATIELRDHHFVTIGTLKVTIGAGETHVDLPADIAAKVESLLVHIGDFQGRVDVGVKGTGQRTFGK